MRHIREVLQRAGFGPSVADERARVAKERKLAHAAQVKTAKDLRGQGKSVADIARTMEISENTARILLS